MRRKKHRRDPDEPERSYPASAGSPLDRTVLLRPISPAGYALIALNFVIGAFALVPPLLWLMANDNASHGGAGVWTEFWRLAFPNVFVGSFLTVLTILTALTGAAGTFIILRTFGTRAAAVDTAVRGAVMICAAGVARGVGGEGSAGGDFGGGGASGSW